MCYYSVLLYVCMVYRACKYNRNKDYVLTLPVFYDCTFPDGNVYIIKICKYVAFIQSNRYYCGILGIWRRPFGIYVYGICKEYLPGN